MAYTQHDLTLYYQGADITGDVDIVECLHRDVCGGEKDLLKLKLDHAEKWFGWGPQANDALRVTRGGYDTGSLFLNSVRPADGAYEVYATGARAVRFEKRSAAYEGLTLGGICALAAGEAGMKADLWGVDQGIVYEYMLRNGETAPAFLRRLALLEGAVIKAYDGRFLMIGIEAAAALPSRHTVELDAKLTDAKYLDRRDTAVGSVTVSTPFCRAQALGSGSGAIMLTRLAPDNAAMALRWAKNAMTAENRKRETLRLEMDFNAGYTAMARIDVRSESPADGKWLIDSVTQDLLRGRTEATLARC